AGARRAAQELEGTLRQMERDVAQDFGTHAVSEADIFEVNHCAVSWNSLAARRSVERGDKQAGSDPREPPLRAASGREALTISVYPRRRVFRKANMSDERMARPVSGEIMTDGHSDAGSRPQRAGADDIIDAEFETIVPEQKPASRARETRNDDM